MNYAQIRKYDIANGSGIRATIFVSGCTNNCPECFNQEYQDFNYGISWNTDIEDKFIKHIKSNNIDGVTILGGEPMQQTKDDDLLNLLKRIKAETNKPIWCYTGYRFEELLKHSKQLEMLKYIDILVDGRFVIDLKDVSFKFKGSSNQRIINVQESLKQHKIILSKYN